MKLICNELTNSAQLLTKDGRDLCKDEAVKEIYVRIAPNEATTINVEFYVNEVRIEGKE